MKVRFWVAATVLCLPGLLIGCASTWLESRPDNTEVYDYVLPNSVAGRRCVAD